MLYEIILLLSTVLRYLYSICNNSSATSSSYLMLYEIILLLSTVLRYLYSVKTSTYHPIYYQNCVKFEIPRDL